MRHLAVLFAVFAAAACTSAPDPSRESPADSSAQAPADEPQSESRTAIVQFLLTSAATDFHAHRPPDPERFRDVRLGHVMTSGGEAQYMLCGEFLSAPNGDTPAWTAFATIRTDPYEQWIGAQAAGLCQQSAVIWDDEGDLSSSLQERLDSLR